MFPPLLKRWHPPASASHTKAQEVQPTCISSAQLHPATTCRSSAVLQLPCTATSYMDVGARPSASPYWRAQQLSRSVSLALLQMQLSEQIRLFRGLNICAEVPPAPAHPQYPPAAALRAVRIASDEKRQLAAARDAAAAEEPERIRCVELQPCRFACLHLPRDAATQQPDWLLCCTMSMLHRRHLAGWRDASFDTRAPISTAHHCGAPAGLPPPPARAATGATQPPCSRRRCARRMPRAAAAPPPWPPWPCSRCGQRTQQCIPDDNYWRTLQQFAYRSGL